MLVTVATLATTLLAQQPVDKSTLELYQERFVLRTPVAVVRVPLRPVIDLPPAVMFRRNDNYAVWDERGLTARSGEWSFTSRLAELPTSSRFFKRDEILATLDAVRRGTRFLGANAISGAKRLGNKAYFVVRWDDSAGRPWTEVLASIDMSSSKPKPQVVGRFEGITLGRKAIDDRLYLADEAICAIVQGPQGWGVGRYEPKSESFTFQKLGEQVATFDPLSTGKGLFVEETSFGTSAAGVIDLVSGDKELLYEGRGSARFIDAIEPRIVVATTPQGRIIVNTATGAQSAIEPGEIRRAGKYVIVWNPPQNPTTATAYDPVRWDKLATWRANPRSR